MTRQIGIAAVIVVLIVLAAALVSPLLGLQGLRDAISGRDEAGLAVAIDSERLRENISARVRVRYAQAGIKLAVEPVVERLLTPAGLITAICDGGVVIVGGPLPRACDVHAGLDNLRFESPDRFSATFTRSGLIVATVVMDRAGLRWKLVDVVLSSSAYDQIKNSVLN